MPFKKGKSGNPKGKPLGAKTEKTKQWESLAESIIGECADRFKEELFALEGKDFVNSYIQVLNYFKPKYQSTELKAEKDTEITVKYERNPNRAARSTTEDTE